MKSLIFAVNCVASQQLEQCERSMNACGHRVGCRLVSVPRTAAHSKAPLSSPWCLDSFSFFQDGELVLEHSTPCWTFWYLQKRQTNKMFLLVLFYSASFRSDWNYFYQFCSHDEPSKTITKRGIVHHFIPSSELKAHTNHKRSKKKTRGDSKLCLLLLVS